MQVYLFLKEKRKVYNQSDFSSIVIQPRSVISEMMNNKREVSEIIVRRICDKFEMISYDWLLTGEGEMLKQQEKEKIISEFSPVVRNDDQVVMSREVFDLIVSQQNTLRNQQATIEAMQEERKKTTALQESNATCADVKKVG